MNQHPYLRAYMAGIVAPTLATVLALTAFCVARFVYRHPEPLERLLIFPMALAPNAWGLWNMLYVRLRTRRQFSIGLYGAGLVFVLMPLGFLVQKAVGLMIWKPHLFAIGFPLALVVYYLVWKHVVGFFNELLGIS